MVGLLVHGHHGCGHDGVGHCHFVRTLLELFVSFQSTPVLTGVRVRGEMGVLVLNVGRLVRGLDEGGQVAADIRHLSVVAPAADLAVLLPMMELLLVRGLVELGQTFTFLVRVTLLRAWKNQTTNT